jgi:hypothetical protein
MNFIVEALHNLKSGATWSLNGDTYDGLEWLDESQTKPTLEEVTQEVARLQAEYNKTEYQRQRSSEYPDLKEFVDAYYWAQKGDNTRMDAYIVKCDSVKDKYPKSE